jgi:hypothetical protein
MLQFFTSISSTLPLLSKNHGLRQISPTAQILGISRILEIIRDPVLS